MAQSGHSTVDIGGKLEVGDHVSWNSEPGRISGRIIRVHTKNISYKDYTHITRARMIRSAKSKVTRQIMSRYTKVVC